MRMIKCNPQPEQVEEFEFKLEGNEVAFYFAWPNLTSKGTPIPLIVAEVTPDCSEWELKRIDNVWYWVKEE